jgi:hypothetical protein
MEEAFGSQNTGLAVPSGSEDYGYDQPYDDASHQELAVPNQHDGLVAGGIAETGQQVRTPYGTFDTGIGDDGKEYVKVTSDDIEKFESASAETVAQIRRGRKAELTLVLNDPERDGRTRLTIEGPPDQADMLIRGVASTLMAENIDPRDYVQEGMYSADIDRIRAMPVVPVARGGGAAQEQASQAQSAYEAGYDETQFSIAEPPTQARQSYQEPGEHTAAKSAARRAARANGAPTPIARVGRFVMGTAVAAGLFVVPYALTAGENPITNRGATVASATYVAEHPFSIRKIVVKFALNEFGKHL